MKINFPQKFPNWLAGQVNQYVPDIIRTRNIRIGELTLTGEIDVKNSLSLLNSYSYLPISIFKDPNYLLSFAVKNKMYHFDSLIDPTITEYSPDISANLNPAGTGVAVYPRGYPSRDNGDGIASSGNVVTANITTFADVPNRTRTYTYVDGQKVLAVRFSFSYTQSAGTNISRLVITDSNGAHIVATETAHAGGRGWGFWVVDGTAGCNLNEVNGFIAKVQISTDSNAGGHEIVFYADADHIDFMLEMGTTQLLPITSSNIFMRYTASVAIDTYRTWYPGASTATATVFVGYNQYASIFSAQYPTTLKMFNDKILMIGNANSIHTVDTTGAVAIIAGDDAYNNNLGLTMGTFTTNRLVLPSNYVIKWIDCSNDTVYIGATQMKTPFSEVGKSVVLLWQPSSDRQEMYDVQDGENLGALSNNYLYLLTSKGNIQILYQGRFTTLAKIYQTNENYSIQLPHQNGISVVENIINYLIPGNKYVPSGIYVFDTDTKQVYHQHSIYHSTADEFDYGGNQPNVATGALYYSNYDGEDAFYAGIDNLIKEDGTFVCGLFDSINSESNEIANYGYIETARIKSQEIDQFVNGLGVKYRDDGSIIISEKKQETFGPCTDGTHLGTWTSTPDPTTFSMVAIPDFMKIGDRITILDGGLRGFSTIVKDITGTAVTIDPPSRFSAWNTVVSTGTFYFLLEIFGYAGALTNATTLSVAANVAALLVVGDELEFISGLGAGMINYVTEIDGTDITLKNDMPYVAGNYVIFIKDKYKYIDTVSNTSGESLSVINASNEPLSSDFVQYKLILSDNIKVRDIQTNVKPNQVISDDSR